MPSSKNVPPTMQYTRYSSPSLPSDYILKSHHSRIRTSTRLAIRLHPTSDMSTVARSRSTLHISLLRSAPSLSPHVAAHAESNPPSTIATSGTPRPSSALTNRKMVPPETEPTDDKAQQRAEDDVEAIMAVVAVTRDGDVGSGGQGEGRDNEEICRWCGGLVAERDVGRGRETCRVGGWKVLCSECGGEWMGARVRVRVRT